MKIETTGWKELSHGSKSAGHLFAVSDLHGQIDMATPLLAHLASQPALSDRRSLISCGDLIDRGTGSLAVVDLMMAQEENFDEVVLLCGNHEIMVLDAFWASGFSKGPRHSVGNFNNWINWGGIGVYDELSPDGSLPWWNVAPLIHERLGPYIARVSERKRPYHQDGDLLFIHAGVVPDKGFDACLALGPQDPVHRGAHWAWTRGLFQEWRGGWQDPKRIIVHGHTFCIEHKAGSADEAADFMDTTESHKRICLDIGGYEFGQLGALEVYESRYRFHVIMRDVK